MLYPALEELKKTHEITLEALEEHHVMKILLKELENMPTDKEEWGAKLSVLKENTEHHVEEETDMFVKARKVLSEEQQKKLAEEMTAFFAEKT